MPSMPWEEYKNMSRQQKSYAHLLGDNAANTKLFGNPNRASEAISPFYDFLFDMLSDSLINGLPEIDEAYQQGSSEIDASTEKTNENIKQQLASSGLGESGVGTNMFIESQAKEDAAKQKLKTSLQAKELDWQQQAVVRLLGLEDLYLSSINQDRESMMDSMNWLLNKNKLDFAMQQHYDDNDFWNTMGENLFQFIFKSLGSAGGIG